MLDMTFVRRRLPSPCLPLTSRDTSKQKNEHIPSTPLKKPSIEGKNELVSPPTGPQTKVGYKRGSKKKEV